MFLISWNVAGWSSTAAMIRNSYGSLEAFFELTKADIICIQECKGTLAKLNSNPVEMGAADLPLSKRKKVTPVVVPSTHEAPSHKGEYTSSAIHGWESFWSFSAKQHRGFNGVVTFARKGLTHRCNNKPFQIEDLDDEGRVVVTYHSHFVLFNVYVPNARRGLRREYKNRFLRSLTTVMNKAREETALPVILAGDLNMTYRAVDACWSLRRIHLSRLEELFRQSKELSEAVWKERFPLLTKGELIYTYNTVANYLCYCAVMEDDLVETGSTAAAVDTLLMNEGALSEEGKAASARIVATVKKDLEYSGLPTSQLQYNGTREPVVGISSFLELGLRSVFMGDLCKNYPTHHNRNLFPTVKLTGLPPHGEDAVHFMQCLLQGDAETALLESDVKPYFASSKKMVDSFLIQQPNAYCPLPFTCWDQSHNCRSSNEGTRIDYILIDEVLQEFVSPRGNTKNNRWVSSEEADKSLFSEFNGKMREDSIQRVMSGGAYATAPYDGSGMPDLLDSARGHCVQGLPSTGLFVTPPQLSDHIGVCVEFYFKLTPREGKLKDEGVSCAYKPPVSLAAFFNRSTPVGLQEVKEIESVKRKREETVVVDVDE